MCGHYCPLCPHRGMTLPHTCWATRSTWQVRKGCACLGVCSCLCACLPVCPCNVYSKCVCVFSLGGRQCKRTLKVFEVFDSETRSWSTLPNMPCKRSYGGVFWDSSGRLCLLGGLRKGGGHQSSKFTKNVNIFDTNQGKNHKKNTYTKHIHMHLSALISSPGTQ